MSVAQPIQYLIITRFMSTELERMKKEVVVAQLNVLTQYLIKWAEESKTIITLYS
jgi:hypothetical protein